MHHALEIPEILSNIFCSCYTPGVSRPLSDLPALARTCRTFKEPALDMLWKDLPNLSPLLQCLPEASEASYEPFTGHEDRWDNLRRYTRRIRSVAENLNADHLRILPNPPTTEPLFPNLRHLRCTASTAEVMPLLHLPFPSLISLNVKFGNTSILHKYFESLPTFSQGFSGLSIRLQNHDVTFIEIDQNCFRHWRNLQTLVCPQITLNVDTLVHLSRLPALTELNFRLDAVFPALDSRIIFPHLQALTLHCEPLAFVGSLLSQTQLPAVTSFTVFVANSLAEKRLCYFWPEVQRSGISHTIQRLQLHQLTWRKTHGDEDLSLGLDDLRPCMAFSNLRCIDLMVEWSVDLTDSDLLTLASAWPRLKTLFINLTRGWETFRGITPNGLLQLLQTCPSLSQIAIAIDTRAYTEYSQSPAILGLPVTLPRWLSIDVVDSRIKEKSVPAISAFFASLGPYCQLKSVLYANFIGSLRLLGSNARRCKHHWETIFYQVHNHVCSSDSHTEMEPPEEWVNWVQSSHVRMGE
ncbi:hypothetical protein EV363DRAFT_1426021 [Boletus edulis]|nr:hypothetical protein EV363DRAFT_1426021 [Boletus edulis]